MTVVLGRLPTEGEVEGLIGTSSTAKGRLAIAIAANSQVHWATDELSSADATPETLVVARQHIDSLKRAIEVLPSRQQLVLELYYFCDAQLREIGAFLGVTESRACQLLKAAVAGLRLSGFVEEVEQS